MRRLHRRRDAVAADAPLGRVGARHPGRRREECVDRGADHATRRRPTPQNSNSHWGHERLVSRGSVRASSHPCIIAWKSGPRRSRGCSKRSRKACTSGRSVPMHLDDRRQSPPQADLRLRRARRLNPTSALSTAALRRSAGARRARSSASRPTARRPTICCGSVAPTRRPSGSR